MKVRSFLPNDMKDQNRKSVLDLFLAMDKASKAEISELTTISFVTVGKIINYFENLNLLFQSGESEDGSGGLGRKRTMYQLNSDAFFTIGIEFVDGKLFGALVNIKGTIVSDIKLAEMTSLADNEFVPRVLMIIEKLEQEAELRKGKIIGVGIGINGAIDEKTKLIRIRVSDLDEQDISYKVIEAELKQKLAYPLIIENDVNASAIAEFETSWRLENSEDLVYISLGDGIGSGIILDNDLRRGYHSHAGELEYMYFDLEYEPSPTSSLGWLEQRIGKKALEKKFNLTLNAKENSSESMKACEEYVIQHLSVVMINLISILDIKVIVLNGSLLKQFSTDFITRMNLKVNSYIDRDIKVYLTEIERPVALGAAILSFKNEISHEISD